jgi:hypothetical protein
MSEVFTPTPYAVHDADDREVLDGILVQQSGQWWLRVDGQATLFGPLQHNQVSVAGDRVCVATGQQGKMYIVWPGGGAAGPAPGGDLNYVHTQSAPAPNWLVAHNLGKFGSVTVVDSGGSQIMPDVLYVDANQISLGFGSATSGKAYVN